MKKTKLVSKITKLKLKAETKGFLESVKVGAYNKALLDVIDELKNELDK